MRGPASLKGRCVTRWRHKVWAKSKPGHPFTARLSLPSLPHWTTGASWSKLTTPTNWQTKETFSNKHSYIYNFSFKINCLHRYNLDFDWYPTENLDCFFVRTHTLYTSNVCSGCGTIVPEYGQLSISAILLAGLKIYGGGSFSCGFRGIDILNSLLSKLPNWQLTF